MAQTGDLVQKAARCAVPLATPSTALSDLYVGTGKAELASATGWHLERKRPGAPPDDSACRKALLPYSMVVETITEESADFSLSDNRPPQVRLLKKARLAVRAYLFDWIAQKFVCAGGDVVTSSSQVNVVFEDADHILPNAADAAVRSALERDLEVVFRRTLPLRLSAL